MKFKSLTLALAALVIGLLVMGAWWFWLHKPEHHQFEVVIPLRELPGISQETIAAQGTLFRIDEPLVYNPSTKMGMFVVEILSSKNFEDETHVIIGGDAQSLECFRNEIRFVNSGPSRASAAGGGVVDGVVGLAEGLWQLVRHPVDSVGGVATGIKNSAKYVWDTNTSDMKTDARRLANAFYCNKASETAEEHHLDYFDLKTDHGKAAIHSEVNAQLVGRGATELALLLVPFSEAKNAGEAAKVGQVVNASGKAAEAVNLAGKMAEAGRIAPEAAEFAKAGRLFPKMVEKMTETLKRLEPAESTSHFKPPVAKLGEAASFDYKATFFAANPTLKGEVVVHHAIEKQVLNIYKGVIKESELHSLENLRGIPKGLDDLLHKSQIRMEWNEFYMANPASTMTKEKLLENATQIDRKFGHLFTPKLL